MKALDESQILVLSGETGWYVVYQVAHMCKSTILNTLNTRSGKSTQVPSFILEHSISAGTPCKILCTEPRRISAISLAKRTPMTFNSFSDVYGIL